MGRHDAARPLAAPGFPAGMIDSRHDARHRQRFPVTVGNITLFTVNLGGGGFCTEVLRVPAPGTPVEGAIRIRNKEYAYAGRVAWVKAGSPRLNVRGRMGISFSSIAPGFEGALASLPGPDKPLPGIRLVDAARKG